MTTYIAPYVVQSRPKESALYTNSKTSVNMLHAFEAKMLKTQKIYT